MYFKQHTTLVQILGNLQLAIAEQPATFEHVNFYITKMESCKLYNIKNMIASALITKTEVSAFIAVPVFKLLSRKILFVNRKDNTNC